MHKKIIMLVVVMLSFFMLATSIPSSSLSINLDVTPHLIRSVSDYDKFGYDHTRVVNPIIYKKDVLTTGNLPLAFVFSSPIDYKIDKTYLKNFISPKEFHKHGISNITYNIFILRNVSFVKKLPHYILENYTYNISYIDNSTGKNVTKKMNGTRKIVDYYYNVTDYQYVWEKVKKLNKLFIKKGTHSIIIDIQGKFKAGTGHRSVDIVPHLKISGTNIDKDFTQFAWWNSSWGYYRAVNINNSGYSGFYQMEINVSYNGADNISASPPVISCNGHCNANFSDLRFVQIDNSTVLPYWIEKQVNSSYALVWVNVSAQSMSDNETLMYYNNSGVPPVSNGSNTFLFFDDFSGDLSKWSGDTSNFAIESGYLKTSSSDDAIYPSSLNVTDAAIDMLLKLDTGGRGGASIRKEAYTGTQAASYYKGYDSYVRYPNGDAFISKGDGSSSTVLGSASWSANTSWNNYSFRAWGSNLELIFDNNVKISVSDSSYSSGYVYIATGTIDSGSYDYWDDFRVRKYTSPEPSWNSFGSEVAHDNISVSNVYPANDSTDIDLQPTCSIQVNHSEGKTINIYWYNSTDGTTFTHQQTNSSVGNGTYRWVYSQASDYGTVYYWKVAINDTYHNVTFIYHFKTKYLVEPPTNFTAVTYNTTRIDLSWTIGLHSDYTRIQRSTIGYPANYSDGTNIYNGTGTSFQDTGLSPGTKYYYRAWGYNSTGGVYSGTNASAYNFTKPESPTSLSAIKTDGTTISLSWNIGTGADYTVIVRKIGSYPANRTDGITVYNSTGTSYTDSGLDAGYTYYYRAWAYDSESNYYSDGYSEDYLLLIPDPPTGLTASSYGDTWIVLTWTKGTGAVDTVIRYSTTGYPANWTSGTLAYNNTGTTVNVTGLSIDTKYYFSAWSYANGVYNDTVDQTNQYTRPAPPTNIEVKTTNETIIQLLWSQGVGAEYTDIVRKVGSIPTSRSDGITVYNGTGTEYIDTGLFPGTLYYYRFWSYSTDSNLYSYQNVNAGNLTMPNPPSTFLIFAYNETTVNITWIKGTGAVNTVIMRNNNTDTYPSLSSYDYLVYNDTNNHTLDNISDNIRYQYSAYSYVSAGGFHEYSIKVNINWGFLMLSCYNESNASLISNNWYLFIKNENGSETYTANNISVNPYSVQLIDLPSGNVLMIKANATNFTARYWYLEVSTAQNTRTRINLYLVAVGLSGGYNLEAVDTLDNPISDVHIILKKSVGGTYVTISSVYTGSYGIVGVFLQPDEVYTAFLSKAGYISLTEDFIPVYGTSTYIFRMESPEAGNITTMEDIWKVVDLKFYHYDYNTTHRIVFSYDDKDSETNWVNYTIYEYNGSVSTVIYTGNRTVIPNLFTINITGNTSKMHILNVTICRDMLFTTSNGSSYREKMIHNYIFIVYGQNVTNRGWIENLLTSLLGNNPFGWVPFIIFVLAIIIIMSFGPVYSGLGTMGAGLLILFFSAVIGIGALNTTLGVFLVLMGVLQMYKMHRLGGG